MVICRTEYIARTQVVDMKCRLQAQKTKLNKQVCWNNWVMYFAF